MIFSTQGQPGTFDFTVRVNTTSQNAPDAKTVLELSRTVAKKTEQTYPQRPPTIQLDNGSSDPPAWLLFLATLIGIILFAALFYCLYVNGFFERRNKGANYTQADTDERCR